MVFKTALFLITTIFLISCTSLEIQQPIQQEVAESTTWVSEMKLTSPAFTEGGKIPSKYTCDGQNINPPLQFSDVPKGAQALVLVMDDPDIPDFAKEKFNIEVWDHWVIFNIPADTREIPEGKNPPGKLGRNTGGNNTYGGPCPPDREHRYFFKLYALDAELELPEGATKAEVEKVMKNHVLAEAKLMGMYERVSK